jgi:Leucine-rich repeat (LRR) protein/signal transduction histidine kinase
MKPAYFYLFYFLNFFKIFNFGKVQNFAEVRNLEVRRVRLTLLILFIGGLGSLAYAQTIDSAFIAQHTYTDLQEALKNPDEVYGLDLSGQELTEFPKGIFQCRNLRILNIGYNSNTVQRNNIKEIPAQIRELKNLIEFYCSENQLSSLPKEIGELKNLQRFDCSRNQLSSLPKEIGELKNLQTFDCSRNRLSSLPKEIGELKKLTVFHCSNNQLRSLPKEIWELKNLTEFYCSSNELRSLPKEIWELKNLTEFYCSSNELRSLPQEIGELKNLTGFDCSSNELRSLPQEIGELKNLTGFSCSYNQLSSLPKEIGELKNLTGFYCSYNQLSSLPKEIGELKNLQIFYCSNNPFKTILPEIFNFLSTFDYGESDEIKKIVAEYGEKAEANRQTIERQKVATEIRNKELEAKNLRALAERERDKNRADSLRRLAEKADLEAKLLRQQQKEQGTQAEKDRLERAALQANNRYQSRLFWVTALIALLIIGGVLAFAYVLNRSRQRQQQINTALQASESALKQQKQAVDEKNQELEALAEELRQQTDTVQAQRDDLLEKTNELEALAEELRQQNEVVELRNLELQALQSTKDLMISAVNHDLRNPLNPILNYSQADYPRLSEGARLALIHQRAKVMFGLIDDIMDVYRADKLEIHPSPNSLHKAVNEAISVISEAKKDLPLIVNEVPESAMAMFEYKYIERVLENLLSNAVKYTAKAEDGGQVRIQVTLLPSPKAGELSSLPFGKSTPLSFGEGLVVRLLVIDNGQGIPQAKFEEIFLPFSNPDAKSLGAAKSVGIGLTFCKTIVELHQSKIGIESEVGKGTTFYFDLPLAPQTHQKTEALDNQTLSDINLDLEAKAYLQSYLPDLQGFTNNLGDRKLRKLLKTIADKPELSAWKTALNQAIEQLDEAKYKDLLGMLEG